MIRKLFYWGITLLFVSCAQAQVELSINRRTMAEPVTLNAEWSTAVDSTAQVWRCNGFPHGGWSMVTNGLSTVGTNALQWSDTSADQMEQGFYSISIVDPATGPDADSDEMHDAWEALSRLKPDYMDGGFDLDGDKLTNRQEYSSGTNPHSAVDLNGNAIPDDWEQFYSMSGSMDDDPDQDGLSNAEEFYYGLDPNVSIVEQFGIIRYAGEAYTNNIYCYSVPDTLSTDTGCLKMTILNSNHYTATFRFGSDRTVVNETGYYILFSIRAASPVADNYPLQLKLNWSSDSVFLDVMPNLFDDAVGSNRVTTGIGTEYITCRIRIPEDFKQFRDFSLLYDTGQGSVVPATFYIGEIAIVNAEGSVVEAAEVLDERHIMITANQKFNQYSAHDPVNHELEDESGSRVTVDKVGLRSWVTAFENGKPVVKHYVYLQLPEGEALVPDEIYSYSSRAVNTWILPPDSPSIDFSYNDSTDISSSIKINQVGYLSDSLKYAYVGNYLGDLGEMPVAAVTAHLRSEANNSVVADFPLIRRPEQDLFNVSGDELKPFSGEEVWVADFSAFSTAGSYYIQIPGLGRSHTFEIGASIYNVPYFHAARTFYYQRSGTPIEAQYAGQWSRPASHTEPTIYHNSVRDKSGELYDPALEPAIGEQIDLTGGWYDAADYNKYTKSAVEALNCILAIYELAPDKFSCDALNIPESGNGVPDIIDQAKWELDWLAKMVSANGAVFNKNSFSSFAYVMPQDRSGDTMYAITKTTRDTAYACAVLAKASRIFNENNWFPEASALYEAKARLAWQCLLDHPDTYPVPAEGEHINAYQAPSGAGFDCFDQPIPDINTGPYYQVAEDFTGRVWAALEMYMLTGDQGDYDVFSALINSMSGDSFAGKLEDMIVTDWWNGSSNPMKLYPAMEIDTMHDQAIRAGLDRVISVYKKGYDQWPYKISMKNTLTSVNFGGFSMSSRWSVYYILFYELLGDPELLTLAKQNMDAQLGANPLSTTFVTGIGAVSPKRPHAKISEFDGIEEAIPGYSVYGCAHSLINKGAYTIIMNNAYPVYQGNDPSCSYYPSTRKFVDAWEPVKMGEFVIDNLARTAMCFGYFSNPSASYQP